MTNDLIDISHSELEKAGEKWFKKNNVQVYFSELSSHTDGGEIPDLIGWFSGYSILIECKASRSDFLADKKKRFRINPGVGMGHWRLYLCPDGMISPEELPEGWGLLYFSRERRDLERVVCWKNNILRETGNLKKHEPNHKNESRMLVSKLRRLKKEGVW